MPVDHSIYFKLRAPDIYGSAMKGIEDAQNDRERNLKLSDLARKEQDAQGEIEARKEATTVNEDGSTSFDHNKYLSSMDSRNPMRAAEMRAQFQQHDITKNQHGLMQADSLARVLSKADESNYGMIRADIIKNKLADENTLPPQYDKGVVQNMLAKTLSYKEQLDYQLKERHAKVEEQKARADMIKAKTAQGKAPKGFEYVQNPHTGEMELVPTEDKQVKKDRREFNTRHANILTEIDQLDKLIDNYGTYEATGNHNSDLAQKLESIAIDSAKMFDPQSVARESEVAAFKKMLFEPGTWTTKNSTARAMLQSYKAMLGRRAENYGKEYGFGPEKALANQKAPRTEAPKNDAEAEAASQSRQQRIAELRAKLQTQVAGKK